MLHDLGKIVFAKSAHVWVHLAFLNAKCFEKKREGTAYDSGHMHVFPAALTNLCFFHIVWESLVFGSLKYNTYSSLTRWSFSCYPGSGTRSTLISYWINCLYLSALSIIVFLPFVHGAFRTVVDAVNTQKLGETLTTA